jgi:thiaminase (transcriptional activator TenA)
VDRVAERLPGDALRRMEEAFLISSRYELAFWEMAWKQEEWPI